MNESLALVCSPGTRYVAPELLAGLITSIRATLMHGGLRLDQKLARVETLTNELAPPPGTGSPLVVAAMIGRCTGPVTRLLERLSGEEIRMELKEQDTRPLTAGEADLLAPGDGLHRAGTLRTWSGMTVADVTSTVLLSRLSPATRDLLDTGVPLGKALGGLGLQRRSLSAQVNIDGAVESSALLTLTGVPVAVATELVHGEFCRAVTRHGVSWG